MLAKLVAACALFLCFYPLFKATFCKRYYPEQFLKMFVSGLVLAAVAQILAGR